MEETLYEHPAVQECAVIGLPDPRWGEQVRACVVLKDDAKADENEIISYCRQKLAKYKCPRSVEFLESLPKDPLREKSKSASCASNTGPKPHDLRPGVFSPNPQGSGSSPKAGGSRPAGCWPSWLRTGAPKG